VTTEAIADAMSEEKKMLNTDLMIQVRNQITMDPQSHYQSAWENLDGPAWCGTTRCMAGWAIHLATGRTVQDVCNYGEGLQGARDDWTHPADLGAELLGLDDNEAAALFYELDNKEALAVLDELIEKGKNQS